MRKVTDSIFAGVDDEVISAWEKCIVYSLDEPMSDIPAIVKHVAQLRESQRDVLKSLLFSTWEAYRAGFAAG